MCEEKVHFNEVQEGEEIKKYSTGYHKTEVDNDGEKNVERLKVFI